MHTLSRNTILAGMVLLGLALAIGCNETPTQAPKFVYEVNGLLVVDPNLEGSMISRSLRTATQVYQDHDLFTGADVTLGSYQLIFMPRQYNLDSVYAYSSDNSYALVDASVRLQVSDGAAYTDTFIVQVPDSFSITNIVPGNRLLQGLDPVSVEWSGSAGAELYVVAAVKSDSAYAVDGYSAFVDAQTTSFTIPPEVFALDNGIDPDTGLYVIYVYAISGSPDSAMAANFLPTQLPGSFSDNIETDKTSGSFGSIVVTPLDYMRVVEQP